MLRLDARRSVLLLSVITAIAAAPAPPGAPTTAAPTPAKQPNWFPLEVGHEWIYQIDASFELSAPGKPPIKNRLDESGEIRNDRVVTEFAGGQPTVEVVYLGWAPLQLPGIATGKLYLAATATGVYEYAFREIGDDGREVLTKHAKPLRLFPFPATPGVKWAIGTVQVEQAKSTRKGEILGFEEARVPAGVFTGCLKYREHSAITGKYDTEIGLVTVEHGELVETNFQADGIGLVRRTLSFTATYREPSGLKWTYKATFDAQLTMHRPPEHY